MGQTKPGEDVAAMTYLRQRGIATPPASLNAMLGHAVEELEAYPSLTPEDALTESEVQAFRDAGVEPLAHRSGPDLIALGRVHYAALLETAITPEQAAEILNLTPGRIRQLLNERRLLGVQLHGRWLIPRFQIVASSEERKKPRLRTLPGLERVLPAIPRQAHLLTVYRWLHTPQPDLRVEDLGENEPRQLSPLQWLEEGRPVEPVTELASSLGY